MFEPENVEVFLYFSRVEDSTVAWYRIYDENGKIKHRLSKSFLRYSSKNVPYFTILGRRVYVSELSALD